MLKRILVLKDAVKYYYFPVRGKELRIINLLTNENWLVAEQSMKIMEMFEMITTLISVEKYISATSLDLNVQS